MHIQHGFFHTVDQIDLKHPVLHLEADQVYPLSTWRSLSVDIAQYPDYPFSKLPHL